MIYLAEEVMELEIKEEPEEEKEVPSGVPEGEDVISAGGGLKLVLENPNIKIEKLIIKKKE